MAKKNPPTPRLLIVENQHEISHLLQPDMETFHNEVEVFHAPSGEEAFLFASFTRIDLLIAEHLLPGMSGIELLQKIRTKQPKVKTILVCSDATLEATQLASTAGADAVFMKPLDLPILLASIVNLLSLEPVNPPPLTEKSLVEEPPQATLAELLGGLRRQLDSLAILLIDAEGQVVARAGDLPDVEVEAALLGSLLTMHSAGEKVSHLLGQQEFSGWSVLDRGENDLVFVPFGRNHALLALGSGLAAENLLLKTVGTMRASRDAILSLLFEQANNLPIEEIRVDQEGTLPANGGAKNGSFESLLDQFERSKKEEADNFWEAVAGKQAVPLNPDTISYEQARKLGLAPDDKK